MGIYPQYFFLGMNVIGRYQCSVTPPATPAITPSTPRANLIYTFEGAPPLIWPVLGLHLSIGSSSTLCCLHLAVICAAALLMATLSASLDYVCYMADRRANPQCIHLSTQSGLLRAIQKVRVYPRGANPISYTLSATDLACSATQRGTRECPLFHLTDNH